MPVGWSCGTSVKPEFWTISMSSREHRSSEREFSGLRIAYRLEDSMGNVCEWPQFHRVREDLSIICFSKPVQPVGAGSAFDIELRLRPRVNENHYRFDWCYGTVGQRRADKGRQPSVSISPQHLLPVFTLQCVIHSCTNTVNTWSFLHTLLVYYKLNKEAIVPFDQIGSQSGLGLASGEASTQAKFTAE